jgi:hypothetical protein
MKVSELGFQKMKSNLKVVLDYYRNIHGLTFNGIDIPESTYFNLWSIVYANKRYTDDNKNVKFVNGKRLFEYDETFEYYPCNTNDKTLFTALKKAINELI